MPKIKLFIGRQEELKRLQKLTVKQSASLVVIKGRRRIGKSRLVEEFSKQFDFYYKFEGLAPTENITSKHQIEEFSNQFVRQFKTAKAIYSDWSDVFWALGERLKSGKVLLFFDELSWMAKKDPTFLSKIKSFWDNQLSKNTKLIFVVCSSASAWLEKNLLSSTAFVGRVSLTIKLKELSLSECNEFWPNNISAYEKFKTLCVTGGVPKYLEEVNTKESAEENIKQLCFTEGGTLVKEFENIFSDLFIRKSNFYKKIVEILGGSAKEQSEIQQELTRKYSKKYLGRLSEYLWELEESGFITRSYTWDIRSGMDSRLSKFRLSDNYLRFYLKYINKNLTKINRGIFNLKSLSFLPEWNIILALQFENLVLNNRRLIHQALSLKADEIVNENPFFQHATNETIGCQIDYMIQTKFNNLFVCEIKFSKNPITSAIISEVENKIASMKMPNGFSYRPVLIHVNGVCDEVFDEDYFYSIIDMSNFL